MAARRCDGELAQAAGGDGGRPAGGAARARSGPGRRARRWRHCGGVPLQGGRRPQASRSLPVPATSYVIKMRPAWTQHVSIEAGTGRLNWCMCLQVRHKRSRRRRRSRLGRRPARTARAQERSQMRQCRTVSTRALMRGTPPCSSSRTLWRRKACKRSSSGSRAQRSAGAAPTGEQACRCCLMCPVALLRAIPLEDYCLGQYRALLVGHDAHLQTAFLEDRDQDGTGLQKGSCPAALMQCMILALLQADEGDDEEGGQGDGQASDEEEGGAAAEEGSGAERDPHAASSVVASLLQRASLDDATGASCVETPFCAEYPLPRSSRKHHGKAMRAQCVLKVSFAASTDAACGRLEHWSLSAELGSNTVQGRMRTRADCRAACRRSRRRRCARSWRSSCARPTRAGRLFRTRRARVTGGRCGRAARR